MPSRPNLGKPAKKKDFPWATVLNASVIVAVLGCIGSIGAALLGADPFAGWLVSILPSPSLTALPPTDTGILTAMSNTPVDPGIVVSTDTPVSALLPGQDWANNCINSTIWKSSLAGNVGSTQVQCHQLSEWGINAQQGRLIFASNHYFPTTAYEYGILTPWHDWKEVDFTVKAERQENSEIWVGFFEGDTPNSTGIIFIIQPEDEIDIRAMPNETKIVDNVDLKYAGGVFHPRIIFEGGKIAVWVDGQGIISKWPVNFIIRNMFVGYRALPSMNLNAMVFDLKFIPSLFIPEPIVPTEIVKNETNTPSSPNSTQIVQDLFGKIDKQLKESIKSSIAFNKPEKMKQEENATVEFILNPSLSQSELATVIVEHGGFVTSTVPPVELLPSSNGGLVTSTPPVSELLQPGGGSVDIVTGEIEITPRMRAVLISQDQNAFTIQELHDNKEQVISSDNSTSWKWSITAKEEGIKTLTLVLYRLVKYEGKEYWREVEAYKAVIAVEVTSLQQVKAFDWKWLAGIVVTIMLALFGYFTNKNKENNDKPKPYKNSTKRK